MSADHTSSLTDDFLRETISTVKQKFVAEKALLGFDEYLEVVRQNPAAQARGAASYLRDCFLYYGTEKIERPYGRFTRYKLFDAPFDGGQDRLIGHEAVQDAVFGLLSDFVRDGRVTKLILLHGPNGSAKSSFIHCVVRALEHYSQQPEGALYTFNWVFPSKKFERGAIGFGGGRGTAGLRTYAHLTDLDVDARVGNELRDHPLLLLPRESRLTFLRSLLGDETPLPDSISEGELSPKSRAIFDALLRAYQGDLAEVLKHVQVERFHISQRYRHGTATVDPQMRVDAGVRQITADRSLGSLPASLQTLALFEPVGDLVVSNRGLLEFNDLLKRPIEAFKYILSTCEKGTVSLETMTLYLDTVFIGSSNATHLDAFTEMADFASFKARMELVQVPYLIDYQQERQIYAEQMRRARARGPLAPHTDTVAALWAVLTRLRRPSADLYPPAVGRALGRLTPLQKAELYSRGQVPQGLSRDVVNELRAVIPALYEERETQRQYEGRFGASPREIKVVLLGAARREGYRCISPVAVLEELRELCRQTTLYEFLRLEPESEYLRPESFIDTVREWYLNTLEEELNQAMGLVDVAGTNDLFRRYIENVTQHVRKEKRRNPHTGRYDDPDEGLMRDVERRLGLEPAAAEDTRAGVMHRIAAWRMDNPDKPMDFAEIFAERIGRLAESFYEEKRQTADRIKRNLLIYLVDDGKRLNEEERGQVEATLTALERDFGYGRECAVDVVGFLLKQRARAR